MKAVPRSVSHYYVHKCRGVFFKCKLFLFERKMDFSQSFHFFPFEGSFSSGQSFFFSFPVHDSSLFIQQTTGQRKKIKKSETFLFAKKVRFCWVIFSRQIFQDLFRPNLQTEIGIKNECTCAKILHVCIQETFFQLQLFLQQNSFPMQSNNSKKMCLKFSNSILCFIFFTFYPWNLVIKVKIH
jgi:hypothetical protein